MSELDPVLLRMVDAFNHPHDDALSDGLFDDRVVVHFFMSGRSGEMRVMEGLNAVMAWIHRAPKDGYVMSVLETASREPHPDLPSGERTVWARYLVDVPTANFKNEGEWTIHITDGRIVALRVEPNDLE